MTTESVRAANRESQRRRRARPEAREIDRNYMRRKRESATFREHEAETAHHARRSPETWAREVLRSIRHRAAKRGLAFDLVPGDLRVPEVCPVLGIELRVADASTGYRSPNSPSVDRIDSSKGYTRDNVRVISVRANVLKNNGTVAEIRAVLDYMVREGAP